eukprot:1159914-Pelagomonas_calceolata.AAC.5
MHPQLLNHHAFHCARAPCPLPIFLIPDALPCLPRLHPGHAAPLKAAGEGQPRQAAGQPAGAATCWAAAHAPVRTEARDTH